MSTNVSNSKKQKDHSELVDEKVEVSTVSESDVAASKEEDPFHTAVESITSSPVTSEKEAEEYVSNQTFAAANEHEMQALISILEGEAPADRKAILKALVQREKLKEGASKKTEVNENELNEDWKHGGYPYKNRMSRKIYEKEKYLLQVELLKLQNIVLNALCGIVCYKDKLTSALTDILKELHCAVDQALTLTHCSVNIK